MPTPRRLAGDRFEAMARAMLERAGLQCLQANFLTRFGEIDLVMRDGDTTVFVEVRYRAATRFATAIATVTPDKQRKLIRAAQIFLLRHPALGRGPCRFDVVGFDGAPEAPRGQWCRNAFELG
jgi:putative endonuclease